jgi:Peptidase family M1 domain
MQNYHPTPSKLIAQMPIISIRSFCCFEYYTAMAKVNIKIFDSLSYSKAASGVSHAVSHLLQSSSAVLRMLSNYVGEELFLKGVSLYLKKKLYANSVTNDLWEGIGRATGSLRSLFFDCLLTTFKASTLYNLWIIGFPKSAHA